MTGLISLGAALGTSGNIKTGPFGTQLQAEEYRQIGKPMISVREIRSGHFNVTSETPRLAKDTLDRLPDYILEPGDIVFARKGGVDRSAFISTDEAGWFLGSDGIRVRPGADMSGRFLSFQVRSPRIQAWLRSHATGSTMPSLSQSILARIPVWVPPLPEQQAIAEVLGALDDKIAANRKLVTTIDDLMVALVTGLEADTPLSDLAELRKSSVQPDGMPVTVSHYSLPMFDEGALPGHELSATIKSGKFSFNHPAVLLSKLNPRFPRIWNVPEPEDNAVASTEFLVLEPKDMSTSTLWALLSTSRVSNYLQEHVSGTTGSHQRFKPTQAMEMPMPGSVPVDLQKSLTSLGDRAVAARYESQTLAQLRDTLLPALMDGTIRVKDAQTITEEAV